MLFRQAQTFPQQRCGFGVILLGQANRAKVDDDLHVRHWIEGWIPAHSLPRQVAQGVGLGDIALFKVVPPQDAQIPSRKRGFLQGQAPAEIESLFRERPGFVELLLRDIDPGQDADGGQS